MRGKPKKTLSAQGKKFIQDYHHDFMQNQKLTPEQQKNWKRKPYHYGGDR